MCFQEKCCFFQPCKRCANCFAMDKSFHAQKCFSTASHSDEALPVFALFLTAGVAASRRRAGRARRHRPVCWSELATRQVHEADARSAQLAAALGTSSSGPHHEPPRASSWYPLAAPSLSATSRSHRLDRSQEETEWQERCAREAAWKLAKIVLKFKEKKTKQHSSHLRRNLCLPAPPNLEPKKRKFVVDSGASMHMISKKGIEFS